MIVFGVFSSAARKLAILRLGHFTAWDSAVSCSLGDYRMGTEHRWGSLIFIRSV
jgi:hypothetical protein